MSINRTINLALARDMVQQLADARPSEVSVAGIGVRQKAPYKAQVIRGALIWRTEEIARSACNLLDQNNTVAGIILVRSAFESGALIWRLRDLIMNRTTLSIDEMDNVLMKMLMGSKSDESYSAINILTLINRIDKIFPGLRGCYDKLSEFAHPNFSGVARAYSRIIEGEFKTEFCNRAHEFANEEQLAGEALCMALKLFIIGYNDVSDEFQAWVEEMDPLR